MKITVKSIIKAAFCRAVFIMDYFEIVGNKLDL